MAGVVKGAGMGVAWGRVLKVLAALLGIRVLVAIVANYPRYWRADFGAEFLRGREGTFWGVYAWAFYAHLAAGPVALVLAWVLMGDGLRRRWPRWHRRLGWVEVGCVLGVVVPSGLVMAWRPAAGPVAGWGLATLAVVTGWCVGRGAWLAVRRDWRGHRRWMGRGAVLLGSAVVLRLAGGLGTVLGVTARWYDPAMVWACWVGPLVLSEVWERMV